jgi:hypothetical protein
VAVPGLTNLPATVVDALGYSDDDQKAAGSAIMRYVLLSADPR